MPPPARAAASMVSAIAAVQSLGRLRASTAEVLSALVRVGLDRTDCLPALVEEAVRAIKTMGQECSEQVVDKCAEMLRGTEEERAFAWKTVISSLAIKHLRVLEALAETL